MSDLRTNAQRVTNPGGPLELLEISNPSWAEPLRIANDTVDWESQGVPYIAAPFGFTTPEDIEGSHPQLRLAVDNVGRGITDSLETLQPGSVTMARLIVVDRLTPNVHRHVYRMPLTSVQCTPATATATASADIWMRQMACKRVMNAHNLPGIF